MLSVKGLQWKLYYWLKPLNSSYIYLYRHYVKQKAKGGCQKRKKKAGWGPGMPFSEENKLKKMLALK